jgi:hypothetical protein
VVQHDLEQRHEGHGEPGHLSLIRALALGVALALGGQSCAEADRVVMASGRDDHGLVERPALGLQRSPTDPQLSGSVQDGRFVRILRTDGPWRYVRAIAPPDGEGWIQDHYLRGEAVRIDVSPPRQVTFLAAELRDGIAWVRVREKAGGAQEWARASMLREIGAR